MTLRYTSKPYNGHGPQQASDPWIDSQLTCVRWHPPQLPRDLSDFSSRTAKAGGACMTQVLGKQAAEKTGPLD